MTAAGKLHASSPRPSGDERRDRLTAARLYLIVDARPGGRPATEVVEAALAGGVDLVQLRDKSLDDGELVQEGCRLREACHRHGGLLLLNDRADLVIECQADGVHLGQDDDPVEEVRAQLGADELIGVSTHSPEQIAAARESLVDYMGVGPVHATPTKEGVEPVGTELVRHAAEHARKPYFAIGGINPSNVAEVVAAGARRVAVVRAIAEADDPRAAAAELRGALDREERAGTAG